MKNLLLKYIGTMLIGVWILGCDSLTVPETLIIEENTSDDFFILPNKSLSINPLALSLLKNANSIKLNTKPKYGELKFLENGLVYYKANTNNVLTTTDGFDLIGQDKNGKIFTQEVKIKLVASEAELPCFAGAIGETVDIIDGKALNIDVLKNDKTCGSIGNLSIETMPKHGKITIVDKKLTYTPEKGFSGTDTFLYKIDINNTKNAAAVVELNISSEDNCAKGLKEDLLYVSDNLNENEKAIDVLFNDELCEQYKNATLKIVSGPKSGTAYVDVENYNKPVIVYKQTQKLSGEDNIIYGLYLNEKQVITSKIVIKIKN
jgi:hypothetical protein